MEERQDLISRQAAIDALDVLCQEHRYRIPGKQETYSQYNKAWQDALNSAEGAIGNLPSAQPEQRWIPCSERLPYTNGIYIVTRRISDGFECQNITDACYFDGSDTWHDDTRVNHERKYLTDVIAWCEPPEPYRAEGRTDA